MRLLLARMCKVGVTHGLEKIATATDDYRDVAALQA